MPETILLFVLVALVALIYSSVGHGGASGYLALLSFYAFPHEAMAASALCLNLLVSGLAFYAFAKAGQFSWKLTGPLILFSIPLAFVGGLIQVPKSVYAVLLLSVLIFAGVRLGWDASMQKKEEKSFQAPTLPLWILFLMGGVIGLLSGIVGVGGGIFLSPLLILLGCATPKQTATTSAFFIWVNSFSGLLGRLFRHSFEVSFSPVLTAVVLSAFLGGWVGSHAGANHFTSPWLKRILALVLFIAAFKLSRSL